MSGHSAYEAAARSGGAAPIDPITTEVVLNRVREIAKAMEHALFHSGYSPILRESQDGSAGITDPEGRVLVISGGLQFHVVPYQFAVQGVLRRYPPEKLREGDSFIVNDPYKGGNPHVPDMIAVTPVFHRGELIGFGVSLGHKPDVGGIVPGSSGAAAREIFHDGFLVPPIRYWTAAGIIEEVDALLRNNSRIPDVLIGDLRAQVGCTRLAAQRLPALCDEYGVQTIRAAFRHVVASTAARVRAHIAQWPDGSQEVEGFLDHDNVDKDTPLRVHLVATKRGDRLTLDFTGTSGQTRGPVNSNRSTVESVSLLAILAATDPAIPLNAGVGGPVAFVIPPRSLISPEYPATLNHYFPTSHLAYSCVLTALGRFNPGRAVAPSGLGTGAVGVGYSRGRDGRPAVQYELMITSLGATSRNDGQPVVSAMVHFTPSTPIEILETEYPVRVTRYALRRDSGGAGRFRGGLGFLREYRFLEDCTVTSRASNYARGSWGVAGGLPPLRSAAYINPDTPDEVVLGPIVTEQLPAGSVLRFTQSGGGGYGDPRARPAERVLDDVRDGYVSLDAARQTYGVVIDPATGCVDEQATARLRGAQTP